MMREASLISAGYPAGPTVKITISENIRRKSHEQTSRTDPMDAKEAIEPSHGAHHDAELATDSSAGE